MPTRLGTIIACFRFETVGMNKLMAMQTFVRVAESGSFSSAAAQLGISVSAVAKTVSRLEDDLGTRLLERSTRRLALNDDGREFYARALQILNDVEDAEAVLRAGAQMPKGRLRIALPVLFARLTFLPRVAEFAARAFLSAVDLAVEYDARTDTFADKNHQECIGLANLFLSKPKLRQRRRVCVVFNRDL